MQPFVQVLSDRELWDIHCASLDTLENVGVDVLNEQAREALLGAGAISDSINRFLYPRVWRSGCTRS